MKEEVFKIHRYSVGHRIDRQLLLSLEDIFTHYNENFKIKIIAKCTNSIKCTFCSIKECFEYFERKSYRMEKKPISMYRI